MLGTKLKKIGVLAVLVAGSVTLMGSFSVAGDSVKIACTQEAVHNAEVCETVLRSLSFANLPACEEPPSPPPFFSLAWMSLVRGAVKPQASCTECQAQVAALYASLGQNQTLQEIENAGHVLCGQLFVNNVTECEAFVDQFVPQVIQATADELPPSVACANLGICNP